MSDIFISYKREDRERAKLLAGKLKEQGYSVWWDRKIPPGRTFDEVIQEALDKASCLVVLWSEKSVHSNWVKEEAEHGLGRGILVPILIDDVPIPLGFGRIQTASLVGWQGETSHPEFLRLARSIAVLLGRVPESSRSFLLSDFLPLASAPMAVAPPAVAPQSVAPPAAPALSLASSPLTRKVLLPPPSSLRPSRRSAWIRAVLWAAVALCSAATGAGFFIYLQEAEAETLPALVVKSVPPADEPIAVSVPEVSSPDPDVRPADPPPQDLIAPFTPAPAEPYSQPAEESQSLSPEEREVGGDPVVEAYKRLAELRGLERDPDVGHDELRQSYEELWAGHRQHLDADAAAEVLQTLRSMEEATASFEALEAIDRRDDLTVVDKLVNWRELEAGAGDEHLSAEVEARIGELETVVHGSATIASADRFVACRDVNRDGGGTPHGIREDFRPGMVHVFAWVHSPRPRETLTLHWLDGGGTVTREQRVVVRRNTAAGYRIFYGKQHSDPGAYEVRLYNEDGLLIGRRPFTVAL